MRVSLDNFQKASIMPYANKLHTQDKAESLIKKLKKYIRKSVNQDPKLFFKENETVYIPDLHGDFVHLILTLYRHDLLDKDLDLKKSHKYIFLGDFYNRGEDSDVIDYWVNKQINRGLNIHRLLGNHEMFFLARDRDDNLMPTRKPAISQVNPFNDIEADKKNNYQVTEDILKGIYDGSMLAAIAIQKGDKSTLYVHSYITSNDVEKLELDDQGVRCVAEEMNKKLKTLGKESYECFIDCKTRGVFNWQEIRRPLFGDPLFNTFNKDETGRSTSYLMRITGLKKVDEKRRVKSQIEDDLPENVYQIVGHIVLFHFDLPKGFPTDRPIVFQDKNKSSTVQFSDVGIGFKYLKDSFNRPKVIINSKLAKKLKNAVSK